jgi:ABC-type polysaccharide/polyol phosphate transport system ATPase subunit
VAHVVLDHVALRFRVFADHSPLLKQFILNQVLGRNRQIQHHQDFWLYRDLNLTIEHGQRVGIVGSNGAGKSTLLKVISGIYHPTSGSLRIRGRIAPLIELGGGFNPELSGLENIYLNGAFLGFSHREMADKVDRILDFANLREFSQMPVKYYSSGMVLRLGFSIATDIVPEILLLDEIFSAGDAEFRVKAQARMHELLTSSHIVVFVSHDLAMVQEVCNRAIWIDHGLVVLDGAPREVCQAYVEKRYPPGFQITTTASMWH